MASSKRLFTGCWSAGSECSAQAAPGSHKGEPHDPLASQLAALSISGATATVSISRAPSSSTMAKQQRIPRSSPGQHHQPAADQLLPEGDPNPRGKDSHHSPNTVLLAGSEASGSSGASTPTACSPLPPTTLRNDTTADSGPPPPSSYRRLWQAVSGVRRGGALPRQPGGGGGSGPVKEVTVDSLVKAVMRARTGQPVVDAVKDGLYCLDGRAVAALLKELAKNGLQYAASELFDWLRQLPPTHPLARLVDVYTYTTIISQCGNHQQLRKALELVAEMRSKGVACNIHTFSALMSVCVKCNECELALDVYEQLLSEGCTPNMVTWNILIDIHSKSGNCEQAVAVLDEIRGQGLTLEARTYNSVITACSKTGQPMQALKVYERMLRDGVSPTGTTYTSLISAYGKAGQVEEALRVYEDMQQRGCECNVITYSSLISACERAGRYEVALQLFERMLREECRPNVVTYNSLIGACGQGGALDRAAEVFEHMVSHGCRPDAVTFSVLIAAYERGGEWGKALQTLERMQQHGFRPDACVYNCVLEALWSTGLAAAQAKAVQLLQFGCRQGHLRMHSGSGREVTAVAHTYAACLLVLLKWLADSRELMSSPPRPGSPLPLLALRLVKGKHCRSDQSYQPIQAALQRMCTAYAVPLTLLADEQGLLVQADSLALAAWRGSEQSRLLLQPLCHPLSMPLPSGTLLQSDALLQQQCGKAFAAVQEFEAAHSHSAAPGSHGPNSRGSLWQSMVDMIVTLAGGLQISEETTHDALQLCDRLLGSGAAVEEDEATAVAACVLLMTCKQVGEARTPDGALLFGLLGLPPQALGAAEERVLSALAGDTAVVSSLRVLQLFLERLGGSSEAVLSAQRQLVCYSTTQLLSKAALTPVFYQFPASAVAAACLHKAREGLGVAPAWPSALAGITRYDPAVPGDAMRECLDLLSVLGLAA